MSYFFIGVFGRTKRQPKDKITNENSYLTLQLEIAYNSNTHAHSITSIAKAPSTRIRIFSNPQLFRCGYGYRPHVYGEFDSESVKK